MYLFFLSLWPLVHFQRLSRLGGSFHILVRKIFATISTPTSAWRSHGDLEAKLREFAAGAWESFYTWRSELWGEGGGGETRLCPLREEVETAALCDVENNVRDVRATLLSSARVEHSERLLSKRTDFGRPFPPSPRRNNPVADRHACVGLVTCARFSPVPVGRRIISSSR